MRIDFTLLWGSHALVMICLSVPSLSSVSLCLLLLKDFDVQVPWPRKESSYRDLIKSTRSLSLASAKAVAAGKSRHPCDVAACASMGKSAVYDLLSVGAALAWSAESEEDKE